MPAVTALWAASRGRVKVELDGEPWRTVPVDVVAATGLHVGLVLDRERLRLIGRELRSSAALGRATRLLATRDLSRQALVDELARRRIAPEMRAKAVARLVELGAVDDERFASRRAEQLASRSAGDALIRADLEAKGVSGELVARALGGLPVETERARAVIASRGRGPSTARYLTQKGFGEDAVESALTEDVAEDAWRA